MNRIKNVFLYIVLGIAFTLLLGPFLVPGPALNGTVPPKQLADPDSKFVDIGGLEVHYKMAGTGEPTFILLHGFLGSTHVWEEIMVPLGDMGQVIAFDRPAAGLTERLLPGEWEGENPYTPEAQADLVIRLMDTLAVERAILVGNSAGGTIATLTALRHPERVQALVLAGATIYSGGGTPGWLGPILRTPQVQRLGPLVSRSVWIWGESAAISAWHDPSKLTPDILEGSTRYQKVDNWDLALWEFTLASHPLGLPERLDQIQMPVLVITGDDDRIVPTEESIRLAAKLPNAELAVLPNCGHAPQLERPGAFMEALGGFLN